MTYDVKLLVLHIYGPRKFANIRVVVTESVSRMTPNIFYSHRAADRCPMCNSYYGNVKMISRNIENENVMLP